MLCVNFSQVLFYDIYLLFFCLHLKSVYFLRSEKINVEGTHRPTPNPLLLGILQTLLAATENRKEISKQKGGTYLHEGRGAWLPYLLASNRQKHVRRKKLTA